MSTGEVFVVARLQERRQQWEERVIAYRSSGQNVREWCAANDVKPERMWYWLRQAKSQGGKEQSTAWLQAVVSSGTVPGEGAGLVVRVGKASVEVRPGFDPDLLRAVIRALSAIC